MTTEMPNKKNSAKGTERERMKKTERQRRWLQRCRTKRTQQREQRGRSKEKQRQRRWLQRWGTKRTHQREQREKEWKRQRDREDDYRDGKQKEPIKELIKGNRERKNEYDLSSVIELVRRADAHSPSYYHRDRDPSEGYWYTGKNINNYILLLKTKLKRFSVNIHIFTHKKTFPRHLKRKTEEKIFLDSAVHLSHSLQ